jgi:sentrin-specific protease 1
MSKAKQEAAQKRLKAKRRRIPSSLPPEAAQEVEKARRKKGIVAKAGKEEVRDQDIARLEPCQWLNDEIINFYGQLILEKASKALASKENMQAGKALKVHYFSSFFWEKYSKSGYVGGRLARWTKKIDIFSFDVIIIPINHGNAHWTSAAINFAKKRIEAYDSMGMYRANVYKVCCPLVLVYYFHVNSSHSGLANLSQ